MSVAPVYVDENDYLGLTMRSFTICNAGTVFDQVNCDIDPGDETGSIISIFKY